jgi:hypothetical protein
MPPQSTGLYYGRLVRQLNELKASECKECYKSLSCAVSLVLHPNEPNGCAIRNAMLSQHVS